MSGGNLSLKITVLRQVLTECSTALARDFLGISTNAVLTMRQVHGIPDPWQGQNRTVSRAAGRVLRRRWPRGIEQPPPEVPMAELARLVGREANDAVNVTNRPRPHVEPKPDRDVVLALLTEMCKTKNPTADELAQAGGWSRDDTYDVLFVLRGPNKVCRHHDTETYEALPEPQRRQKRPKQEATR